MAMRLTNIRHAQFEQVVESILLAFANKEVTLLQARGAIAHIFTATAMGQDEGRCIAGSIHSASPIGRWNVIVRTGS